MEKQVSENSNFRKSVFISHASKNFKLADEIRESLERQGVSCWIAPRDIPAGHQYGVAIIEAIRECTVTLLVLTDDANKSKPVANEIERAFSYQKIIIPIRLREVLPSKDLEFFVANAQWINAFASPLKARIDEVAKIVQAIEMGVPVSEPAPEAPTLAGRTEMYLERALRRKMLSATVAFGTLAALSMAVIGLQLSSDSSLRAANVAIGSSADRIQGAATQLKGTADTVDRIDSKMDYLKRESSADPRKELANQGVAWSNESFREALGANDLKILTFFMDGKFDLTTAQREISQLFLNDNFVRQRPVIDLLHARGVDFLKDFPTERSSTSASPLNFALSDSNVKAVTWLLENNDKAALRQASYDKTLSGVVMAASWCTDSADEFKLASLLVQAGAPTSAAFETVFTRLTSLQNVFPANQDSNKEMVQCKAYVDLLRPQTRDSASLEKAVRMKAIESMRGDIDFVRNIVHENRWREDDAGVYMIVPGSGRDRMVSYGQMKVEYAEMIKRYEKRIAELQRG